jgi:ribosomal protein S6--L-glutamate ligase
MSLKLAIVSLGSKSSKMLAKEALEYFEEVKMIDIRKIEIRVSNTKTEVLYDGEPLENFDCMYLKGSYRYASLLYGITEIFKKDTYIPIDSNAHIVAHNKFMTHLNFSQNKALKMPGTYFAAKISEAKKFLNTLNYPIILKFPSGTHGKGVIFTDSYKSATSMVDALDIFKQPVIVQDYINIQSDIRVIVAGEKIIGSMRRIAKSGEIRANAHQGGNAEPFIVTTEIKKMCIEAAKKIKAEICAIDIIESEFGPLILEVNTSPGLQKITEVTKKNIAKEMAEYLYTQTKEFRKQKDSKFSKNILSNAGVKALDEGTALQAEIKVRNDKIILPEFAYKMSHFQDGDDVTIQISKNQIILTRN